jgi:hypothetical protein
MGLLMPWKWFTVTIGNASPGERSEQLGAKGFKIDIMAD